MRFLTIFCAAILLPAQAVAQSSGTGFFVGPDGLILTSHHVVEGAHQITCRTVTGATLVATVLRSSAANDLAVLRVDHRPSRFLGLAPVGSLHIGQRVFTIGFPLVDILGSEPRYTDGTVSALSFGGEDMYVQVSIPVQPGNSGGPIVNEQGQVVGILAATARYDEFLRRTGTLPQNVSWGIKADYAAPLLGGSTAASERGREEAIELVRDSLCHILARPASTGFASSANTSLPASAGEQRSIANGGSVWEHNGSLLGLQARGRQRVFVYLQLRGGIPASPGDIVFNGERNGSAYRGTAYRFSSQCGRIGYSVEGLVAPGERQVTLRGNAPRRDRNCRVVGYIPDQLVFRYIRAE